MLSLCLFEFSVGIGDFVTHLPFSDIFSCYQPLRILYFVSVRIVSCNFQISV